MKQACRADFADRGISVGRDFPPSKGTGDQATWSFEVVDWAFDRRRMSLDAAAGFLWLAAR
jgi:hypothetical protein